MKNPLPKLHNRDKLFCYGTEKRECHVRAFGKVTRGKVALREQFSKLESRNGWVCFVMV